MIFDQDISFPFGKSFKSSMCCGDKSTGTGAGTGTIVVVVVVVVVVGIEDVSERCGGKRG